MKLLRKNDRFSRQRLLVISATILVATTLRAELPSARANWPAGLDPVTVGRRVVDQFLITDPEGYKGDAALKKNPQAHVAKGYSGSNYGQDKYICYSVASIFVNAFEFAKLTNDKALAAKLDQRFLPFLPGGAKADKITVPRHVDFNIFGAVPLEHFLMTGNAASRTMGLRYADDQWEGPRPDDTAIFTNGFAWLERHWNSEAHQRRSSWAGAAPLVRERAA